MKIKIFAEASGLRGSIRLVKVALTNEKSGQTDPRGPETDQKGPKSQKTDQQPGKPLAPISSAGGIVAFVMFNGSTGQRMVNGSAVSSMGGYGW